MKKKLTILPLTFTGIGLALTGLSADQVKAESIENAVAPVTSQASSVTASQASPVDTSQDLAATTSLVTNLVPEEKILPVQTEKQVTALEVTKLESPVAETAKEGQEVDLRILATTDLHTNLVNYDYYQDKAAENIGLANTAVLIEDAKKENSNVILVDNGDTIQGTPLGTYKAIVDPIEKGEQHPMYAALEKLGYDAGTLGNHEFNYGLDYLDKVIETADIPLLNANVLDANTGVHRFTPYKIIEKTFKDTRNESVMLKVGITGIVPPQILIWDKAYLEGRVKVEDSIVALNKILPEIKKAGADLVVVLSHSGIGDEIYEMNEENVAYHITKIPGVDAIVTGHSHGLFPNKAKPGNYEKLPGADVQKGQINGKPIVMAGKYGDHLGIIDLKVKYEEGKWKVVDSQGNIKKLDPEDGLVNEDVLSIAKEAHEGTVKYVNEKVGQTSDDINSYFALVQDDPSVQIVNQAQLWFVKNELKGTEFENLPLLSAAAPFKAGARDDSTAYTDIKKGSLAIKNVADLYLYDNVAAIIKLTGAQLKEWLEMSAGQFNTIDPNNKEEQELVNTAYRTYNFDVIDGVDYDLDVTQKNKYDISGNLVNENSERVKNLTYKGQVVDPKQEFIVVTNNYRMSGKFPGVKDAGFKQLLSLENRQAIINYIVSEKNINPTADFNWNFVDTIKGLNLTFKTAQIAKGLLERYPNISYLADVENGFTKYKYDYKDRVFKVENPIEENQSQVEKTNPVIKDQKDDLNSKNQEDLKEFEKEIENTKVADIIERISSKEKAINTWTEKVVVEDSLSKDSFRKTLNLATKQSELKISSDTNKSSLLPKTNISTDSDVKLPAALATILIAAGLMVRRKENRIK